MPDPKKTTTSKKPSAPAAPNFGFLNHDWQGPDTRTQAMQRAIFATPGNASFTPQNFGYPPGTQPTQEEFNRSDWSESPGGWAFPVGGQWGDNVENNFSLVMDRARQAAQRYGPRGTSAQQSLAAMLTHPVQPGTPYSVVAQQAQRKHRSDLSVQRDVTAEQSVPRYDLRTILWGQ